MLGANDKPILLDVRYTEQLSRVQAIIFVHGYKGFKDWGRWNEIADFFADNGYCFIKFNMSHNGTTPENSHDFVDLEAFKNNTYSKELADLNSVISWFNNTDQINSSHVRKNGAIVIGHSRGGGIATVAASRNVRVDSLITWAGVSDFKSRFPYGREFDAWKQDGVYYSYNSRTGQKLPHGFSFYEDFIANEQDLDIRIAAKSLVCPHLIIHGSEDEAVHVSEALRLHRWSSNSKLELIEQGDHTFGMKHDDDRPMPVPAAQMIQRTLKFIKG
ncbi:MAG: alpha/beta fold hydrolase [Cryomorphaceae bacterium]|nr:alpha/beta fold hydrolase [Cryomorphaceae bacterium]